MLILPNFAGYLIKQYKVSRYNGKTETRLLINDAGYFVIGNIWMKAWLEKKRKVTLEIVGFVMTTITALLNIVALV